MGTFTKDEFVGGLRTLGLDTIEKIQDALDDLRSEVNDQATFVQIYKYAFEFYREPDKGKNIDTTAAHSLLGLLLPTGQHISRIRQFLSEQTEYKVINMDQWLGFLEVSRSIDENFGNLLEDDAWPSILDAYVEWAKSNNIKNNAHSARSREENESAERSIGGVKSSKSESDG